MAQDAVSGGIILSSLNHNDTLPYTKKWNIMQAIFFSSTVLTTIGKFSCVVNDINLIIVNSPIETDNFAFGCICDAYWTWICNSKIPDSILIVKVTWNETHFTILQNRICVFFLFSTIENPFQLIGIYIGLLDFVQKIQYAIRVYVKMTCRSLFFHSLFFC